ncbi:hypothetical protein [Pandoraea pnomenusa]|uniref:hypothetical protein n=1 Tax=Pandoraea pnomenusa TaxID=93220 RepID=UPI00334060BC
MYRIDDATAATALPAPEAAGTEGFFTEGNPASGTPATNVRGSWLNMIQEELRAIAVAGGQTPTKGVNNQVLAAITRMSSGVVGASRNLVMNVSAASASATVTADELIVEAALGGLRYCLGSFNQTINLSTTGAGGVDTGAAPVSGFVGIYAIFNPSTGARSTVARNATSAAVSEVYGGANMPAGFTASALIAVVPTNASGQFSPVSVKDRHVDTAGIAVMSATAYQAAYTSFSVAAAVPLNAKRAHVTGFLGNTTANSSSSVTFSGSSVEQGVLYVSGSFVPNTGNTLANNGSLPILTPQTLYWKGGGTGTPSISMNVTGYDF